MSNKLNKELKDYNKKLDNTIKKFGNNIQKEYTAVGLDVLSYATPKAPANTGNLRRSGYITTGTETTENGEIDSEAKANFQKRIKQAKKLAKKYGAFIQVGYSANYAAEVHNNKKNYRVGGARFLSKAIKKKIDEIKKAGRRAFDDL